MSGKIKDLHDHLSPEDPVKASVFLDEVYRYHHIDLSSPERQIVIRWKEIATPQIAAVSSCTGVKNGTLFVSCNNQSESALVRLNQREIIKNAQSAFPELNIVKLSIRVR